MNAQNVLSELKRRVPNEPEYHQAVEEVLSTIEDAYNEHPEFDRYNLIERLCIPDRIFSFRVTWLDDKGKVQTNMGYRVQHNNAIGPYKGGIRFHSSVNLSILKFLAFEQTFKNSLTTLPMGVKEVRTLTRKENPIRKSCVFVRLLLLNCGVISDRKLMFLPVISELEDVRSVICMVCIKNWLVKIQGLLPVKDLNSEVL